MTINKKPTDSATKPNMAGFSINGESNEAKNPATKTDPIAPSIIASSLAISLIIPRLYPL